jgi:cobalt-zinc-cadmium efflux system outer membrane protein
MSLRRLLALSGVLFLSGCLYQIREQVDQEACRLAVLPYDRQAELPVEKKATDTKTVVGDGTQGISLQGQGTDIQTAAYMQADELPPRPADAQAPLELNLPTEIPGSEVHRIQLPKDPAAARRTIRRLYPKLEPLPPDPQPLPGPNGKPYTLADLQQIAATNSPQLRQAISDVHAARGNLIQARAYPNPTVSYLSQPSSDGSTSGVQGWSIDQVIRSWGKLKLAGAAAEMDLLNAELALRRARSDLSTAVRNAYFAVLVAKETVRVTKALARFTDEVYRLITGYLAGAQAAPYEPSALRGLANTARLSYEQAIAAYTYSWKQLVAALGLRQLPLTALAGRLDAAIPYYDYDVVLDHVLKNHTDVLIARNGLDKARYNLKLAQIAPFPDPDVNVGFLKDISVLPKQFTHTVSIGIPFPIWDRNRGNIMAAEAALYRAKEEPHRVEESLTNTLAIAYTAYRTNLKALEYYRVRILPDQVRTYLGALQRRQSDPMASVYDLVGAQQTLAANVSSYLSTLGSLWSSVVSVADLLQTDDLFQLGKPRTLPPMPDLDSLRAWPCCYTCPPPGSSGIGESESCSPVEVAAKHPLASSVESRLAGSVKTPPKTPPKPEAARPIPAAVVQPQAPADVKRASAQTPPTTTGSPQARAEAKQLMPLAFQRENSAVPAPGAAPRRELRPFVVGTDPYAAQAPAVSSAKLPSEAATTEKAPDGVIVLLAVPDQ